MFRAAVRLTPRQSLAVSSLSRARFPRRYLSSRVPADKSRSWKSLAARWGLAFGAVLYYNTSPVFAEDASLSSAPPQPAYDATQSPTVESVIEEKRAQLSQKTEKSPKDDRKPQPPKDEARPGDVEQNSATAGSSPQALEDEAGEDGAFNPETGEINWDCPCLGGMAHGPCGEEFKAAFSCFVHSNEDPKGVDCIDKFQHMQDCFRKYPDIYGAELSDDDQDEEENGAQQAPAGAMQKKSEVSSEKNDAPSTDDVKNSVTPRFEDARDANNEISTEEVEESKRNAAAMFTEEDTAVQKKSGVDGGATTRSEASDAPSTDDVPTSLTPRYEDARDANNVVSRDQDDESRRKTGASSEKNSNS